MVEDHQGTTVLIVDDDYYFATEVLGYHLRRLGYTVHHAYAVDEFHEKWKDADVVILDIRLPQKVGLPIDPWGGLNALSEILRSLGHDQIPQQLRCCIIRSAQTMEDAVGARVEPPEHLEWYRPDEPLSTLFDAVRSASQSNTNSPSV